MIFACFFIWVFLKFSYANQFYDPTVCSSNTNNPGTRYTCDASNNSTCETFVIYRASQNLKTISKISALFKRDPNDLLPLNNLNSVFDILELGREIIVPINCSCTGEYFQANISYLVQENTTLAQIACEVFDSLLKSTTLIEENPSQGNNPQVNSTLNVPIKCACPDNSTRNSDVKYLVTYAFVEGDYTRKLGQKFGVATEDILAANNLGPNPTVYPSTTVLVPLKTQPVINMTIPNSDPPTPGFLPTIPVEETSKSTQIEGLYIGGSIVGFVLIVTAFISMGLYIKALRKIKAVNIQSLDRQSPLSPRSPHTVCSTPRSNLSSPFTNRSSTTSCLSPDLLAGIKYSLCNYSVDEIKKATNDFSEDVKLNAFVYKGLLENVEVMIKQMRFEDTRLVIDVHSKVNHKNITKLLGVCYGENDFSWSYLVFEFPSHGCLRDCLSNSSSSLRWHKRTQVAFDIATGLHYLHYCIIPPYTHLSINSKNIFVTQHWKGKLAIFGSNPGIGTSKENESNMVSFSDSLASEKMDIFAFGIVLLELISAREDKDGNLIKESIGFLGGGGSEGGCFEQLRNFIDPCLNEDYPLAEALCLAVLAKACVEDDPMKRPSIDDIMKVLARMV